MTRLNVGCGATPTNGWKNYDNSWTVRFARKPIAGFILGKFGILNDLQRKFISVCKSSGIQWADVTRAIPEPDGSVEVLYSSHMIEHLDKDQVLLFLKEVRRILVSGGIIRLAVPNVRYHVENYLQDRDADKFIANTLLTRPRPNTFLGKLKYLFIGDRHHLWMYDGESLCKLLASVGFEKSQIMDPGETMIRDPGGLDLREREPESVFVEAYNP